MKFHHKSVMFSIMISMILLIAGYASASSGEERIKEITPAFEKYAEDSMKEFQVPGMAIGIVYGDKLVYARGFGVKKLGGTDPVTPDTIFEIGSCSKAFTSALVGVQVDQGKVGWDDKVIDYLPDFRMYDPWVTREFTVTDLMAQRSGLKFQAGSDTSVLGYNQSFATHGLRYIKPETSFRSTFAYQNVLYAQAATLTEKVTGKTWDEALREEIFEPLGMSNSTSDMRSYQEAKDVAYQHAKMNGTLVSLPMDWEYMDDVYLRASVGGINSNIPDMAKWVIMHMNNGKYQGRQVVSESSLAYTQSPKTIMVPGLYYCLGWEYHEHNSYPIIDHGGNAVGHTAQVAFVPQAKVGIVILANIENSPVPDVLKNRFMDMYFGSPERDYIKEQKDVLNKFADASRDPTPPQSALPPLSLDSYTGNFSNPVYGRISVAEVDGSLAMTLGARPIRIELKPWNRDTFLQIISGMPDVWSKGRFVTFQAGPDGKAESVRMDLFIEGAFGGKATFDRI